jgi:hypothetical protein
VNRPAAEAGNTGEVRCREIGSIGTPPIRPAASPAAVGAGQGEKLREALAQWLCERVVARDRSVRAIWTELPEPIRVSWREWADEILALPELAPLLAAQAAAAEAIREVHQRDDTKPHACDWCGEAWPCTPIRVLDGSQ